MKLREQFEKETGRKKPTGQYESMITYYAEAERWFEVYSQWLESKLTEQKLKDYFISQAELDVNWKPTNQSTEELGELFNEALQRIGASSGRFVWRCIEIAEAYAKQQREKIAAAIYIDENISDEEWSKIIPHLKV